MLLPSIKRSPEAGYINLNKQFIIVDFPEPVRPTIPIFYPIFILIVILSRVSGRSSLYLTE